MTLSTSVEDVEKFRTKKKWKMPWLNAFGSISTVTTFVMATSLQADTTMLPR